MNVVIMIILNILFGNTEKVSKEQSSSIVSKNVTLEMNYDDVGRKGKVAAGVN
jgi:hypothetical protein